ncbi:WhiB family transcriptional regulator [Ornithinimicrobium cerasi]|uniref:WhiB family transcriptional regulator n=1 Tax=Ornithinimicrobium cerasi TaxID=2248773 RepID=UPI000F0089E3|nr:WhiB family transcriptional regulator [Ornithinimicrobium cerasi]
MDGRGGRRAAEAATPRADLWEWQLEGLCRSGNPEVFFHPDGERGPARAWRQARAVAVCRQCPVMAACREHALRYREPYGIWGGMTEEERQVATRAGRPAPVAGEG